MFNVRAGSLATALFVALTLLGCGGGGSGDDEDQEAAPFQELEGTWFGPSITNETFSIAIDADGNVGDLRINGVSPGALVGRATRLRQTLFLLDLDDGDIFESFLLLLDATGQYATLVRDSGFDVAAVQRDATQVESFGLQEFTDTTYIGQAVNLTRPDFDLEIVEHATSTLVIDAAGSFQGVFGSLVFQSANAESLTLVGASFEGPYIGSDNASTSGEFLLVHSPDGRYLAGVVPDDCPIDLSVDSRLIGGWLKEAFAGQP